MLDNFRFDSRSRNFFSDSSSVFCKPHSALPGPFPPPWSASFSSLRPTPVCTRTFSFSLPVLLLALRWWRWDSCSRTTSLVFSLFLSWCPEKVKPYLQWQLQGFLQWTNVCNIGVMNRAAAFRVAHTTFQISSKTWRKSNTITCLQKLSKEPNGVNFSSKLLLFTFFGHSHESGAGMREHTALWKSRNSRRYMGKCICESDLYPWCGVLFDA